MTCCIYLRKSRVDIEAEAHGEGDTLARHERALLELAKIKKCHIGQIHREIVSGETIAARPVMQQLLQEVEQGIWDGVFVMEVERLARGDTIDQGIVAQTFKFSDTKIITPTKTYDPGNEFDEEYFEFGLFMSRREYKTINRRLQRGRLASVNEGKYVCSVPPYGYQKVRLQGEKGFTLTPAPVEADIVRLVFDLYTKGEPQSDGSYRRIGISLIVRRLNKMGIKPRKSDHWATASIRDMLINPVYIGKIRWNWRADVKRMVDGKIVVARPRTDPSSDKLVLVDGRHPAIIDEETFNLAQEYIASNRPNPVAERGTVKNPLSGLIICAKCGHRMVRRPYQNNYPDTLMCADPACDNVSCALSIVEERLLEALREWLDGYRLEWEGKKAHEPSSTIESKEKTLRHLDAEYDALNKQLDSTYDFLEQGVYTTEEFLKRSRNLAERIEKNKADRSALGVDIEKDKAREASHKHVIPKVEYLLDVYKNLPTPKAKNDMLKEVLEKVVYLKTKSGRYKGNAPDDFELTLYPKIPASQSK